MLKDKERCETVIHNAYEKAFSLYDKFYIATNYIKSKQAKTYNGFYEEPVTLAIKHVATEKPKEKCIIRRILNIFYKNKKNEQ